MTQPYSEAQTRQEIIDKRLALAGWDLNDPSQVTEELDIDLRKAKPKRVREPRPRYAGHQFVDYALLHRGKPVAVVEAKKTSKDAQLGQEQALQYAKNLQQLNGGPLPFVSYTNGYDIYFWDSALYPPVSVHGFPTPSDLEWQLERGVSRRLLSLELIDTDIVERDYQIAGIRTILEQIVQGRQKFLLVMATGTGKTRVAVALTDVLMRARWVKQEFRIPLPPLAEQRRIAAILDKADAIRRKRREAIGLLDEFLRSAFLEIVGPRNPKHSSWPVYRVEQLAAPGDGAMRTGPFGSALRHSEFVDRGVAVLGIDNAVQNRFAWCERRFITPAKYEKFRRYTVKPRDVIVTIMGTTGRSAVVPEDIPLAISTKHLAVITVDRELAHPEYVSHALYLDPGVLGQIAAANRGAIMSGLNLGLIKRLHLNLPPMRCQERFVDVLNRIRQANDKMQHSGSQCDDLFNSLSQRAFRGR